MLSKINNLAHLMKAKMERDEKFVLMLGAGASLSSGVKTTDRIMHELVEKFGADIKVGSLSDRFDTLWRASTENDRVSNLNPYLAVGNLSPGIMH